MCKNTFLPSLRWFDFRWLSTEKFPSFCQSNVWWKASTKRQLKILKVQHYTIHMLWLFFGLSWSCQWMWPNSITLALVVFLSCKSQEGKNKYESSRKNCTFAPLCIDCGGELLIILLIVLIISLTWLIPNWWIVATTFSRIWMVRHLNLINVMTLKIHYLNKANIPILSLKWTFNIGRCCMQHELMQIQVKSSTSKFDSAANCN